MNWGADWSKRSQEEEVAIILITDKRIYGRVWQNQRRSYSVCRWTKPPAWWPDHTPGGGGNSWIDLLCSYTYYKTPLTDLARGVVPLSELAHYSFRQRILEDNTDEQDSYKIGAWMNQKTWSWWCKQYIIIGLTSSSQLYVFFTRIRVFIASLIKVDIIQIIFIATYLSYYQVNPKHHLLPQSYHRHPTTLDGTNSCGAFVLEFNTRRRSDVSSPKNSLVFVDSASNKKGRCYPPIIVGSSRDGNAQDHLSSNSCMLIHTQV